MIDIAKIILNAAKKDYHGFLKILEGVVEEKFSIVIGEKVEDIKSKLFKEKEDDDKPEEEEDADGDDSEDDKEDEDNGKKKENPFKKDK